YLIDFSLTCRVPVSFNGEKYDIRSIRNFARLYWPEEVCDAAVIHYEWPTGKIPDSISKCNKNQREKKIAEANDIDLIPIVEILALSTPDNGMFIAYVNGLLTSEGGVHVD